MRCPIYLFLADRIFVYVITPFMQKVIKGTVHPFRRQTIAVDAELSGHNTLTFLLRFESAVLPCVCSVVSIRPLAGPSRGPPGREYTPPTPYLRIQQRWRISPGWESANRVVFSQPETPFDLQLMDLQGFEGGGDSSVFQSALFWVTGGWTQTGSSPSGLPYYYYYFLSLHIFVLHVLLLSSTVFKQTLCCYYLINFLLRFGVNFLKHAGRWFDNHNILLVIILTFLIIFCCCQSIARRNKTLILWCLILCLVWTYEGTDCVCWADPVPAVRATVQSLVFEIQVHLAVTRTPRILFSPSPQCRRPRTQVVPPICL